MDDKKIINKTAYKQDYFPPVPTPFTRAARSNFFWQIIRFIAINIKMMKLILKSHH